MEDIELDIQDDSLAEALQLLKEASSYERGWATTKKGEVDEEHDPPCVSKKIPRLPWHLLKTFRGPNANIDALCELLPISGPIWQDMAKRSDQRGMHEGEVRLLPTTNPPRPKKYSCDVLIEYKCPWAKVCMRLITCVMYPCIPP